MKTLLLKVSAVCLLLLMVIPMLLPVFNAVEKLEIREKMLGLLQQRELQTLQIAEKDVVWMDKHEIWVNEQMFDVATSALRDGMYTFTGLYDEEETKLVKMEMEAGDEESNDQRRSRQLVDLLHIPFLVDEAEPAYPRSGSSINYPQLSFKIITVVKRVIAPPPKAGSYYII